MEIRTYLSFLILILAFNTSCQRFNSDSGNRASNALCQGINPLKPYPTIPSNYNFFEQVQILAGTLPEEDECSFAYRRVISISPATDLNEKQVKVTLTTSNFNYANANSDGSDIRFLDDLYNIFDHWIEAWDPLGTSIVWVKIPSADTEDFFMIYGNPTATDTSDAGITFSYSTPQTNYFELRNSGSNLTMNVASYSDSNTITVTTNSGTANNTLSSGSVFGFSNSNKGPISSNGPIEGKALNDTLGYDTLAPLAFTSTLMGYPKSRGGDTFEFYNPNSTTANITITNYDTNGNNLGNTIDSVLPGEFKPVVFDFSFFGLIESDLKLLGFYQSLGSRDSTVLVPGQTQLLGVNSSGATIGILEDGTTGTVYLSSGGSEAFSGNKGDTYAVSGGSISQGAGVALNIVANKPIVGVAQADSDGSESFSFWPPEELSREYIIPTNSQYVAISTLYTSTITVYRASGSIYGTVNVTSDGVSPAKALFGSPTVSTFSPGARVVSDKPFFMYYEYENQDETNILGSKINRLRSTPEPVTAVGEEYKVY